MAIRAITLDFGGTLVREDNAVMMEVCRRIAETAGRLCLPQDAARILWEKAHAFYTRDYADGSFVNLRAVEEEALRQTLRAVGSAADARELADLMNASTAKPELFPDVQLFFMKLPLPVLILTNGDRAPLEAALTYTNLPSTPILCSEDVSCYKPRKEIFEAALRILNLPAEDVLHVGDSLVYDVAGAAAAGMKTAWVNRGRKPLTGDARPDVILSGLAELKRMMGGHA